MISNERAPRTEAEEEWEDRIRAVCEHVREASNAAAVMLTVFDAPWMDLDENGHASSTGLAGREGADVRQMAKEIREYADVLDRHADRIATGEAFIEVTLRTPTNEQRGSNGDSTDTSD